MALQGGELSMVALPVIGDHPQTPLQPPLLDGVHLRWGFRRDRGFPWRGFYLFRRTSFRDKPVCLARWYADHRPGLSTSSTLATPIGQWVSNTSLIFSDWFPAFGASELSLLDRHWLRFDLDPAKRAHAVRVRLGFRRRACIKYALPRRLPAPWTDHTITFRWLGSDGRPLRAGRIVSRDGITGVDCAFETHIQFETPLHEVDVSIAHFSTAATLSARDRTGKIVSRAHTTATHGHVETIKLHGQDIVDVLVHAPRKETLIVEVCPRSHAAKRERVEVVALSGNVEVSRAVAEGTEGELVDVALTADAITAVRFSSASAAVIDLCFELVENSATHGWKPVDGFVYPMPLPTANADYPCPGKPATAADARAMASSRVHYGPAASWSGAAFDEMSALMDALVTGGPTGTPMVDRASDVLDENGSSVTMPAQHPLHLLLLGTLNPAVAQILGLYFIDRSATPGETYDYLIIADDDGLLGGTADSALAWIAAHSTFAGVDAWIKFGVHVAAAPPLETPADLRAYSLPSVVVAGSSSAVGLRWDRGLDTLGNLGANGAVAAFVWKAFLGEQPPQAAPPDGAYEPIDTVPVVISDAMISEPERPDDWPALRMYVLDGSLDDGWYSYRINGVDIFGRHSKRTAPATWWQWAPAPSPRPWYYEDPEGDRAIHPFAVHVLDTTAPPAPVAVEAQLLDPDDPLVVRDSAYNAWRAALPAAVRNTLVGLRVRWSWRDSQRQQAPDAAEFRLYFHPGPWNTLLGSITGAVSAGPTTTDVATTLPAAPNDHYVGARLRCGNGTFEVVASSGAPLRLTVNNRGPAQNVAPPAFGDCSVVLPPSHVDYRDPAVRHSWEQRIAIEPVDITRDDYDVFLPRPSDSSLVSFPLTPTLAEPRAYAQIGVSAADSRPHALDDVHFGTRPGNESAVAGPATVVRIRREPPPPLGVVADSDAVFSSPADVHSRSFYTFRFAPMAGTRTHVLRALDRAVFERDWALRPRGPLATTSSAFPAQSDEPGWNTARRAQVAAELDALDAITATRTPIESYRALSNDAQRVLAALPGVDAAFHQLTLAPLHPDDPAIANRRGPDDPATIVIDPTLRAYVDTLDGRARNRYFYRAARIDGAGNLSALGVASPPVNLPHVVPPPAPKVARIEAREGAIEIVWPAIRDRDVISYSVFRASDELSARDPRTMTEAGTVTASGSPRETFTDAGRPPGKLFHYRVVAVDSAGLTSVPSAVVTSRAFGDPRPAPPAWQPAHVSPTTGAVTLHWISTPPDLAILVERSPVGQSAWTSAGRWLARGSTSFVDTARSVGETFDYRLRALDSNGKQNRVFNTLTA